MRDIHAFDEVFVYGYFGLALIISNFPILLFLLSLLLLNIYCIIIALLIFRSNIYYDQLQLFYDSTQFKYLLL